MITIENIYLQLAAIQKEILTIQGDKDVKKFRVLLDSLTQKLSLDVSGKTFLKEWCMKLLNQCNAKISEIST